MGGTVRHLIGLGRSAGQAAMIAGAAAALLSTGAAITSDFTPSYLPPASFSHGNLAYLRGDIRPRPGSARRPVRLSPGRSKVAGRFLPGAPSRIG